MKKKSLSIILCIVMVFCLVGCRANGSTTNNVTNNITNEITNKVVNYEDIKITDLENAVEETVKRVENAVIGVILKQVSTVSGNVTSEDNYGIGSGVIYKRVENYNGETLTGYTYYAITNRHVVTDEDGKLKGESKVYVYLGFHDLELEAKVIAYDDKDDLACITFNSNIFIQPVEFADSDQIKKGSFVIAVGNPEGFDYYGSVTFGVVSGPLRYISADTDGDGTKDFYGKYIQHDASINPGNSGGGLFTLDGKLIGINTLKISSNNVDNMGFAIPSNEVKLVVTEYLEKNIKIVRPRLGISGTTVRDLTPATISQLGLKSIPTSIYEAGEAAYGIYIRDVTSGGTMSSTTITADDILLTFDGVKLKNMSTLSAMLNTLTDYKVGSSVKITYYDRSENKVVETNIVLKA